MSTSNARRPAEPHVISIDSPRDFATCASRLKALADGDRLRIVMRLLMGELSVSALADELDEPVDKISHHLGILKTANLVQSRKEGKFVIYSLGSDVVEGIDAMRSGKSIDLGCCQLDLVQATLPARRNHSVPRRPTSRKAKG